MLAFNTPVKFLGTETKSGVSSKNQKPWSITEAKLFIPDLGRVRVVVRGNPKLPPPDSMIHLQLSVEQGGYQKMDVVFDESSLFKIAA